MTPLKQISALVLTLSLLLPFSAACTPSSPNPTQSALPPPEQWVSELENKHAPASELRTLHILGSRAWKRGALVFLSYRDEMGTEMFGYSLMFGIVAQPTAHARELLVLGDEDQVLRTIELPAEMPGGSGIAGPAECPPN